MQAGALDRSEYVAIRAVQGYSRSECKRVDAGRATARVGRKKAEAVALTPEQAAEPTAWGEAFTPRALLAPPVVAHLSPL